MTGSENKSNKQAILAYAEHGAENADVIVQDEAVWVDRKSMAQIFGIDATGVSRHIRNIFDSGELDEDMNNLQKLQVVHSKKPVDFYSLDVAICVGYRVNSQKATQFRIWATNILKQYIKDGYVLNEALLRGDPEKLSELAAKLRELRANEKNVYASVRECFKIAASDYESSSRKIGSFYALLQEKFHHAITQMTSSKLIIDRADHAAPNMGLITFEGIHPKLKEAKVGKNFLREGELYRMHLLSEQFLLFAESTALQGKSMTMSQLHKQLDNLLLLNGYPLFDGYKDFIKDRAMKHAEEEFQSYMEIEKLKLLGVDVDLQDFYDGEYKDYKEETAKLTPKKMNQMLEAQQLPESEKQKALPPYNPWG